MKQKIYWLFVLIIIPIAILVANYSLSKKPSQPEPTPIVQGLKNTISITIDFGDGKTLNLEAPIKENLTAFTLLEKISEEKGLDLKTKKYDFGIFVESINGLKSDQNLAWIYFVNGKSGETASDQYVLKEGDLVEWKYQKPTF